MGRCGIGIRGLVAVWLGCVAAAMFVGSAQAAFPGRNGPIAFASDATGSFQIYRMSPSGRDVDQLTHTSKQHASVNSDWSPNGRELAFDSDRTGTVQIFTMHADGGDVEQLTHLSGFSAFPSWSPDGRLIVFSHSSVDGGPDSIYTIRSEGGGLHRLTHAGRLQDFPRYSPDGRWIPVLEHHPRPRPGAVSDARKRHAYSPRHTAVASRGTRRLVAGRRANCLGNQLRRPTQRALHDPPRRDPDRAHHQRPHAAKHVLPTYSPSGHQIVFVRSLNPHSANDLWIVNANGTHPHDITNTPNITEFAPDWGPAP
jgi:Tol biopolymer transport system component